jgi:hypothetical protein
LAKHVCGSCRFFDEARDGKHGWCTHPDRRESTSVRILVRAAELRCRNDWGNDLWRERSANDLVLDVVMNEPLAPQTLPSERRLTAAESSPLASSNDESRSVQSTPVMSFEPNTDSQSQSEDAQARTVSDDLNRELLRQAHNRIRERQRNKGYSIPPKRATEGDALVISNQYIPPSRNVETPISRGLTDSVFEFANSAKESTFDEVPELSEPAAERRPPRPVESDSTHILQAPERSGRPQEAPRRDLEPSEPVMETIAPSWSDVPLEVEFDSEPEWAASEERQSLRQADLEAWDPVDDESIAAPRRLWSVIPRCCQTCKDFRPAGNGQRGWCNNQWAFKHRRMVDADDIPCETSIGNWWLPGDEAWQGVYDISALGQPTPLMDKWFGRSVENPSIDLPAERQRRRTGSW